MRYYTNSEMQTFADCRRRWWLGTFRRLRPRARRVTGAAPIGTRVHQALAPWYVPAGQERLDPRWCMEQIIAQDRAALLESIPLMSGPGWMDEPVDATGALKTFDSEADLCRAMIQGYMEWIEETGVDSDYEVIGSEHTVQYEFAPGESIAGRIDTQVIKISTGAHLGIDHKTGDFGALRKRLRQDEQMLRYEILRRVTQQTGVHSDGMMFNMIRKVKRTAAAKPPFYDRMDVQFNQHQIDSAWYRTMGVINDIRDVTRRLESGESHLTAAYPRPTGDCDWKCEFAAVCPMFDDGSRAEAMLESLYDVGDPLDRYPELKNDDPA